MRAAYDYGADAVYAGSPRYSLRARNNEFAKLDVLEQGIKEAHERNKKFFLTVNTLPHNSKLKTFVSDMEPLIAMKPDALIMADPGLIMTVREKWPGMPIHLSVQANTTNYILDQMTTNHLSFDVALRQAQELGFAEADPTADIEGKDAAAKAAILAGLAFHTEVHSPEVFCEGISSVTEADIQAADQMGCVVKLLAVAKLADDDRVIVKVHPAMVPKTHPLASVSGAYNAIFVESVEAGQLMFLGQGAGGAPTASAVMGDVVTAARNRVRGTAGHLGTGYTKREVAPIGDATSRYYIRFQVEDKPGVLAKCATIFGAHRVSLQTCQQSYLEGLGRTDGFTAELNFMTHDAREQDLQDVVAALREAPFIGDSIDYMRIEGK